MLSDLMESTSERCFSSGSLSKVMIPLLPAEEHLFLMINHHYNVLDGGDNYCPQRSCEDYVFTCVCLSTGGVPGQAHLPGTRYTPQELVPPRDQVPPGTRYTPTGPGTPPGTRYIQVHPQETASVADGTHPTGMYSCLIFFCS